MVMMEHRSWWPSLRSFGPESLACHQTSTSFLKYTLGTSDDDDLIDAGRELPDDGGGHGDVVDNSFSFAAA
ncbi:unnamed protein product [Linum trigynum]|uniref:Uncharacterized protein n=1 Tax=Linum trigynum TaxID=586398 RepID=A0AAV2DYL7_9ROSI